MNIPDWIHLSPTSRAARSTFDRYLLTLKQGELVTAGDPVSLTDAGLANAPIVEVMPPPGEPLFAWWCAHPKVGVGPRAILNGLRDAGTCQVPPSSSMRISDE